MTKLDRFIGHRVIDRRGKRIGTLDDYYRDDRTGRALWLKVKTGWLGRSSSFVALAGSEPRGDDVVIAFDQDDVKHAPIVGLEGPLSETEDAVLADYYAERVASQHQPSSNGSPNGRPTPFAS